MERVRVYFRIGLLAHEMVGQFREELSELTGKAVTEPWVVSQIMTAVAEDPRIRTHVFGLVRSAVLR